MKKLLLLGLGCFMIVGCESTPTGPQPTPIPLPIKTVAHIWPKEEFNVAAQKAIKEYGKDLLAATPKDIDTWCLNFGGVDKVSFYSALLSNMAKYESNFRPELQYIEKFREQNGKGPLVISRGLLQVSWESCKGYGTKLDSREHLHDIHKNLECSVRILNKLVVQDNLISALIDGKYKGAARYWSVIRPDSKLSYIKSAMMGACK